MAYYKWPMRPPPTRSLRAILVLLLLQVPVVGAWAPHAAARRADAAHVEAASTANCPASHDEDRCLACQAISLRGVLADAAPFGIPGAVADGGGQPDAAGYHRGTPTSPSQPRAPPTRVV